MKHDVVKKAEEESQLSVESNMELDLCKESY
jgi:hypothetical protein